MSRSRLSHAQREAEREARAANRTNTYRFRNVCCVCGGPVRGVGSNYLHMRFCSSTCAELARQGAKQSFLDINQRTAKSSTHP